MRNVLKKLMSSLKLGLLVGRVGVAGDDLEVGRADRA